MGCFFACFRIKAGHRSPLSSLEATPCKSRDRPLSRNQLASLLLCEEEGSPCEVDIRQHSVDRELKHEAKFLKACGALLETPAEVRKGLGKTIFQTREEYEQLDTPCKKLQYDEQPDQLPNSPPSAPDDCLPDDTCASYTSVAGQTVITRIDSAQSDMFDSQCTAAQSVNESPCLNVIEDGKGHEFRLESASKHVSPFQSGRQVQLRVSKDSPYPTPLRLTDELETPGTIYPGNSKNCGFRRNNPIQSQYAFSIQNSPMNLPQIKRMSKDRPCLEQRGELFQQQLQRENSSDTGLQQQQSQSSSTANEVFLKDTVRKAGDKLTIECLDDPHSGSIQHTALSAGNTTPVVLSLSQWLKPQNPDKGVRNDITLKGRSQASKSPEEDRPIIGMVAAHWNDEETTRTSPKLWDGNGIPNSTNKYKEDQRVSWHATPFEERLEKALSDEKLFPQRKLLNGKPIEFDEDDEIRDTAAS